MRQYFDLKLKLTVIPQPISRKKPFVKLWLIIFTYILLPFSFLLSQDNIYRKDVFSFDLPSTWKQMEKDNLMAFRQQYEMQSAELYQQYNSGLKDYDTGVPFLVAFRSHGSEATLVVVRMKIPPQTENYLKQSVDRAKDIINWGIQTGRVRQAHNNKLIDLKGNIAHYSDLEMGDESRLIGYSFYLPEYPYQVLQLVALFESGSYFKYKADLNHIIESLDINIEREVLISNKAYKLSSETQKYLVVNGENDYEAKISILIVQEPHYDIEAQWNLYKGLSAFFHDNPELIEQTVFLAEGVEANKSLSVEPLIEVAPDPLEQIVRITLNSFLITGYVGYEWKNENDIPIIGIEDSELYRASSDLWMAGDTTVWPLTVTARNKQMLEILTEKLQNFRNPILFVGGMHLHSLRSDTYETVKKSSHPLLNPNIMKRLSESENLGIIDYLKKFGIGYIYLEPVSHLTFFEYDQPSEKYRSLFLAQKDADYGEYIKDFISNESTVVNDLFGEGVTVTPSPQVAAHMLLTLQKTQGGNKTNQGTTAKESKDKGKKGNSFWNRLKNWRGKTKTNGESGKKRRYFEMDRTHGDLEGYDRHGNHIGSFDPKTGIRTKPPIPGRRINI